jgi:hypothetical protein
MGRPQRDSTDVRTRIISGNTTLTKITAMQ